MSGISSVKLPAFWGTLPHFASIPFEFEAKFDGYNTYKWFVRNWTWISLLAIATYLTTVVVLTRWMRQRKRFEMKGLLFCWNLGLAIFSICCTWRTLPELMRILALENGYHKSICDSKYLLTPTNFLWTWWFALSKIWELGDTIFITLRKRPLTFLHVYHHCSVLFCSWYCVAHLATSSRWFVTMNSLVHSLLYLYYAVQVLRFIRIPRAVSMTITILQILQMVIGVAVNYHGYQARKRGEKCDLGEDVIALMGSLYFSYFLLFVWFFYNAYFRKKPKTV